MPGLFSLVVGLRSTLLLTSLRTTVSTLFLSLVTAVVAVLATVAVTATLAFPDINSRNGVVRGYAERNAINAPIQGSAADIIKVAMAHIYQRFQAYNLKAKMILQVHDELNFSVPEAEKELVQKIVIEEMEQAYHMHVPLKADCGWGNNWLQAH